MGKMWPAQICKQSGASSATRKLAAILMPLLFAFSLLFSHALISNHQIICFGIVYTSERVYTIIRAVQQDNFTSHIIDDK